MAPADNSGLFVDGDGGGSTTGLPWGTLGPVEEVSFADEPAVASPPSDCSLGIWTLRRGRLASDCVVFEREGGGGPLDDDETVR